MNIMDVQTGLICVGVVVVSAVVIYFILMFGIKEKSYEEAIAEQRKLPDDLLFAKKDKGKEKKHKSKTSKKVKEKKEEKEERDEKPEHVQFEETPQILTPETNIQEICKGNKKKNKPDKVKPILLNKDEVPVSLPELLTSPPLTEYNHFDVIHPKDEFELIRSQSKENLQFVQSEQVVNKSPKESPMKTKKNIVKEPVKKKDEIKEEKKDAIVKEINVTVQPSFKEQPAKETKELQKDVQKDVTVLNQSVNKESKKNKKKNDILAQIGGDKDGINVSLLMPLVQKAELSRSEIQILIDQLLNKQLDNPMEHSEWTEGRADPVIKLKKQLAEKDKALAEEHEASATFQNKLKELRVELNSERSRLTANVKQLEEALNTKITEAQTLHTRMQHILESHAAEKQGFARQIEQLQAKVNEDAAIIHKMQEDQGQTQGHLQQELIAQRKQLEVQFAQMRENENALKAQLAQKHVEVQELQNVNMSMTQELQATCESSTAEIEMLRQQLGIMQEQFMHSEGQLQHFKEASDRLQDMARQLEDSHRAHADLDHRLKSAHRHEQELQKQIHALQAELKSAKTEANDATALNSELTKAQSELMKLKSDLSVSQSEAKNEATEITNLRAALQNKDDEFNKLQAELQLVQGDSSKAQAEVTKSRGELIKAHEELKQEKNELKVVKEKLAQVQDDLLKTAGFADNAKDAVGKLKLMKAELEKLQNGDKKSSADQIQITKLQEENDRLSAQIGNNMELQKELKRVREENENLVSQLAAAGTQQRTATAEGHENGVEEKADKSNAQKLEQSNLLAQKDKQLDALKTELLKKQAEFNQLNAQVEVLRRDANNQSNLTVRLQEDLEAQRSKNNELRTKNWKVMEALTAAESRAKANPGKNIDEDIDKIKIAEQESTKSLLQRIFPEIKITEKSYDKWLNVFEERIHVILTEAKNKETQDPSTEIEKQNKNLQSMVAHYQQIIVETEGMLNNLQNHVESEESRWQLELRQKENELANLRLDLKELRNNTTTHDKLQEKISQLESRLKEETQRGDAKAQAVAMTTSHTSPIKSIPNLANVEQLHEEKLRLSQELEAERSKNATLGAELSQLRSIVENSASFLVEEKNLVSQLQSELVRLKSEACGASSSSDQSVVNGPQTDSSKSERARASNTLIAAIEKVPIKNAEIANPQRDIDHDSFTSELNSDNCHTTAHDTQASCNPMNGQQHKKHKKKRKGGSGKK